MAATMRFQQIVLVYSPCCIFWGITPQLTLFFMNDRFPTWWSTSMRSPRQLLWKSRPGATDAILWLSCLVLPSEDGFLGVPKIKALVALTSSDVFFHHTPQAVGAFLCVCVLILATMCENRYSIHAVVVAPFLTIHRGLCRECHISAANEDSYDIL